MIKKENNIRAQNTQCGTFCDAAVDRLVFLLCIPKISGPNLGTETENTDWESPCFIYNHSM
jgi:hypothetical protein